MGYMGLQKVTGGYKRLKVVERVYTGHNKENLVEFCVLFHTLSTVCFIDSRISIVKSFAD